uniref:LRAT domain-containing protein n=1 Tax=Oryzias sinensis TaxID=183150 RepID=A0A8C7WSV7_9TELE
PPPHPIPRIKLYLEIVRGPYSHWAVCVGNGEVVHFGTPGKNQCSSQTSGSSIDGVGGIVKKEKLEDVAGKDSWRVNNILDEKYKPLPPDEIVKKACSLVEASPTYNLTKYNCEHFATEMRYGIAESSQVGHHCWCFSCEQHFCTFINDYGDMDSTIWTTSINGREQKCGD